MSLDEFHHRRQNLLKRMAINSLAIIPTASLSIRNSDVHYSYRPDSDFYYLTGFAEPEAVAVLVQHQTQTEYILFCRERDEAKERWNGPVAGPKGAVQHYGADKAFPISELDDKIVKILEKTQQVYYAIGCNADLDQRMTTWLNRIRSKARTGVHGPETFHTLDQYLHELRLIKSPQELETMRTAATISAQAHNRVMQACRPGITEYTLEAEFLHECTIRGARQQAYSPIVGSGANGCVLHYESNCSTIQDGDLVLIDAGCEYNYYASDITRTFPANGRFSPPQRELYELVLEAQTAALKKVKPGNHWKDPHQAALRVITKGLVEFKILKGTPNSISKLIREEQYKPFYMHKTGHWLGMDVHDVGAYKVNEKWRLLEPGMCLTVEPGLYIAPNAKGVPKRWRGIGIRIEDDVIINAEGNEILSLDVPKGVNEIESLIGS